MRLRAVDYFGTLAKGSHLIFTHGGLITSYLYKAGVTQMPNNCSFLGVHLVDQGGEFRELAFQWEFPYIEEDI